MEVGYLKEKSSQTDKKESNQEKGWAWKGLSREGNRKTNKQTKTGREANDTRMEEIGPRED